MARTIKDLEYLKSISSIQEYLKNSPLNEKSLKTYFLSLDKFIPFLAHRFKENYKELIDFDLTNYYDLNITEKNELINEWNKNGIIEKLFEVEWKLLNANNKANLLMKWAEMRSKAKESQLTNGFNTYLNYIWRIQGFCSKLGFEYEANPKNLKKIQSNGFHLEKEIDYEDVIQLYEKIDNTKYKIITKIIVYTGLNPADIVLLRPIDFERFEDSNLYVLIREREKTKNKGAQYLIVFHENFIQEIKDYFERKIIVSPKKENKEITDSHFHKENNIQYYQYNWIKDNKKPIFDIKSTAISDIFKYHVNKNNLNPKLMPSTIRRLCFTRLKSLFSLADKDIYDLWTQHKAEMLTRHYITDLMIRFIADNYIEKIQDKVLIGNVRGYINEINGLKNGMNRINQLENILTSNAFKNMLNIQYERLVDDHNQYINADKKFQEETQELENDFQDLKELMDKIDNLKSK